MYRDVIESIAYSISFDFGSAYSLSQNFTSCIVPVFVAILGIKIGISLFRECIK